MPRSRAASIASNEINRFSEHAEDWWNPDGAFKPLHRLNPLRVEYVRDQACAHFGRKTDSRHSLKDLKILDVGCGGGLLAEPLARLGGDVTGIDASAKTILVARQHAKTMHLAIDYRVSSVEELVRTFRKRGASPSPLGGKGWDGGSTNRTNPPSAKTKGLLKQTQVFASSPQGGKGPFDLITALEIIEHVADVNSFMAALAKLLKPGGLLVMSTLNRTPKSFLLGIVAAEYVLGWIPRGTHDWKKFIRPSELVKQLEENDLKPADLTGMIFNPLRGEFVLSKSDLDVNYLVTATCW